MISLDSVTSRERIGKLTLAVLVAAVVTLAGPSTAASEAQIVDTQFKRTSFDWVVDGPPFDPRGDNQTDDPANQCCQFLDPPCTNNAGPYAVGDTVQTNTYFSREFIGDASCTDFWDDIWWSFAYRLPITGRIIVWFLHELLDFGSLCGIGFQAGDVITFCAAALIQLPPQSAGLTGVEQGFSVETDEGSLPPTFVASFDIAP